MVDKKNTVSYETLRKNVNEIKNRVAEVEGNFEKKVGEHPLQSVAIAFSAGALMGALAIALLKRK